MPHLMLRITPLSPSVMHGHPAAVVVQKPIISYIMDRSKFDNRSLQIFEKLAAQVMMTLTPRESPSEGPWGRTRLPLVETDTPDLTPVITSSGIVCPLPLNLVTPDLAYALEALWDDILCLYHPIT